MPISGTGFNSLPHWLSGAPVAPEQVQKVLRILVEEHGLADAHLELLWALTEKARGPFLKTRCVVRVWSSSERSWGWHAVP